MAFWKVYKYRSKHRYMYDWIWWYKTIGQYPKDQWDAIKKELHKQREKRKEEGLKALDHFLSLTTALCANRIIEKTHVQTLLDIKEYLES